MPISVINTDWFKKTVIEKKAAGLLYITQVYENNVTQYDFLKCPLCKRGRLCDIPHGGMAVARFVQDVCADRIGTSVVVKCPKCSSKFIIYIPK